MEVIIGVSLALSLFFLGVSVGAIIENKRIKTIRSIEELDSKLRETREILLPLADKISHYDMRPHHRDGGSTLIDYNSDDIQDWDPDETLEIPVYESLTAELEAKEETWQEEQINLDD